MHFNSRFHKAIDKTYKKIDTDKFFNLNKKKDVILPLGSCFLDEFSYHLVKNKFKVCEKQKENRLIKMKRETNEKGIQFFFGNFYNPLNLLHNLERIVLKSWKFKETDFTFSENFGHYINLYIKSRYKTKNLKELISHLKKIDYYLLNEIKKSSVILLCFDGTEVWIDRYSRKAWHTFYGNYLNQKPHNKQANLKVLNYIEVKKVIKRIIELISKFGNKKFILMNSPHSLITTYTNQDNQIADHYAKSTFLSVFTDLQNKNIAYFPIYEILDNLPDKQKFEKNYLYINSKTKKNIILPKFEELFF